jgi:hypothetical protein
VNADIERARSDRTWSVELGGLERHEVVGFDGRQLRRRQVADLERAECRHLPAREGFDLFGRERVEVGGFESGDLLVRKALELVGRVAWW